MPATTPPSRQPKFQSALPLRGATWRSGEEELELCEFQSALPLRGATQNASSGRCGHYISIRAPLAGSDVAGVRRLRAFLHFNPRSPCGERLGITVWGPAEGAFQSALPLRGATSFSNASAVILLFQSALPLRGATACPEPWYRKCRYFNPRSPCGERHQLLGRSHQTHYFNPRSPCGERLNAFSCARDTTNISIRAPLAGSDGAYRISGCYRHDFNPRSPCGERRSNLIAIMQQSTYFNPRSPCGERHAAQIVYLIKIRISIRAPLAGSDGRRDGHGGQRIEISIRAPLAGSDGNSGITMQFLGISIRAPLAGSDIARWYMVR